MFRPRSLFGVVAAAAAAAVGVGVSVLLPAARGGSFDDPPPPPQWLLFPTFSFYGERDATKGYHS